MFTYYSIIQPHDIKLPHLNSREAIGGPQACPGAVANSAGAQKLPAEHGQRASLSACPSFLVLGSVRAQHWPIVGR